MQSLPLPFRGEPGRTVYQPRKHSIPCPSCTSYHSALRVEPVEGREAKVGVGDVDELHFLRIVCGFLWDIRGCGCGGKVRFGYLMRRASRRSKSGRRGMSATVR